MCFKDKMAKTKMLSIDNIKFVDIISNTFIEFKDEYVLVWQGAIDPEAKMPFVRVFTQNP